MGYCQHVGKKKHDTIEGKIYDNHETELPTEEWTEHITAFLGKGLSSEA